MPTTHSSKRSTRVERELRAALAQARELGVLPEFIETCELLGVIDGLPRRVVRKFMTAAAQAREVRS